MPDVSVLDVRLYDQPIGTLTHLQGERTIFAFNEDYVEDPDRPTLSLSFKDDLGGLITKIRPTQRVVPPSAPGLIPSVNSSCFGCLGSTCPEHSRSIQRPAAPFRLATTRICRRTLNLMRCAFRSPVCS